MTTKSKTKFFPVAKNRPTKDDYIGANRVNKFTRKTRIVAAGAGAAAGGYLTYGVVGKGLAGLLLSDVHVATSVAIGAALYGLVAYGGVTGMTEAMTAMVARTDEKEELVEVVKPVRKAKRRNSSKVRPEKIKEAVLRTIRA